MAIQQAACVRVAAISVYLTLALSMVDCAATPKADRYAHEKEPNYWHDLGDQDIQAALRANQGGVAKNVIIFLGDGMGVTTSTGARIWAGQQLGLYGEEHDLSWDRFPFTGLSKTYCMDGQTTDSAASGTAFLCGVKTRMGLLGLSGRAALGNCSMSEGNQVESILNWSLAAGKSVGVVSTARISHATPAATYAKSPDRRWESDRLVPESEKNCKDIAYQLVMQNPRIQVIIRERERQTETERQTDRERERERERERREKESKHFTFCFQEWKKEKAERGFAHRYVYDKTGFDSVDPRNTEYLLGLFNQDHMQYEVERNKTKEPSIADMTAKAVQILSKNPNGFFLFVESGRIDHANHDNWAHKAFAEVEAMNQAVLRAKELTADHDTLIVVSADHSHVLSIAGYADRGNPITDGKPDLSLGADGLPYTTLIYGNGPGRPTATRANLTDVDTGWFGVLQLG
ncbi:hypothetical protein EGW08_000666, partial [Elysia chlorotica]